MAQCKPSIRINKRNFTAEWKFYPTYKELKRNLGNDLNESYDGEVTVNRSKRGCWGEWFENWRVNNMHKPYIIKEGWT